jgi:hypothetical protein
VANTSATGIYQKLMWFVLAYAAAGCSHARLEVREPRPVRSERAPRWAEGMG